MILLIFSCIQGSPSTLCKTSQDFGNWTVVKTLNDDNVDVDDVDVDDEDRDRTNPVSLNIELLTATLYVTAGSPPGSRSWLK